MVKGKTYEQYMEAGRKKYRQFLKEDMEKMKNILEGLRYFNAPEMLEEYKWLAFNCLRWKRLIKLNK